MRLLGLEYYKIKSRFMVQISILLWLLLVTFLATLFIFQESVEVNNVVIPTVSKEMIKEKQQVQAYQGALTDEKAQKMLRQYGFSSINEKGQWVGSYISDFLTKNMTVSKGNPELLKSGVSLKLLTVAESFPEAEAPVQFGYAKGWLVVLSAAPLLAVVGNLILILIAAPVFTEERETNAELLILTSFKGRGRDIYAKIGVLYGYVVFLFAAILLSKIWTGNFVCGLDGWNTDASMLGGVVSYGSVGDCITGYFAIVLTGFFFTVSLTFCISAFCKYTIEAAGISSACVVIPWAAALLGNPEHPVVKTLLLSLPQVWMTNWSLAGRPGYDIARCGILLVCSAVLLYVGKCRYTARG